VLPCGAGDAGLLPLRRSPDAVNFSLLLPRISFRAPVCALLLALLLALRSLLRSQSPHGYSPRLPLTEQATNTRLVIFLQGTPELCTLLLICFR